MIKEFLRPQSISEAVKIKAAGGTAAVYLAGGTVLNVGPGPISHEQIISLESLDLSRITKTDDGLIIGAGCKIQDILEAETMPVLLKEAARQINNRTIRQMATIGGNVASNQANGTMLVALAALEAEIELGTTNGIVRVTVDEYIGDRRKGLVTAVVIPIAKLAAKSATRDFKISANDRSVVIAATTLVRDGDQIKELILAMGGVAKRVQLLAGVGKKLNGRPLPPTKELEALVSEAVDPSGGINFSAGYKKHLAGLIAAQTIVAAYNGEGVAK